MTGATERLSSDMLLPSRPLGLTGQNMGGLEALLWPAWLTYPTGPVVKRATARVAPTDLLAIVGPPYMAAGKAWQDGAPK